MTTSYQIIIFQKHLKPGLVVDFKSQFCFAFICFLDKRRLLIFLILSNCNFKLQTLSPSLLSLQHSHILPSCSFKFMATSFINCDYVHTRVRIYTHIHIPKYNLLGLYNTTHMYVFTAGHLVLGAN